MSNFDFENGSASNKSQMFRKSIAVKTPTTPKVEKSTKPIKQMADPKLSKTKSLITISQEVVKNEPIFKAQVKANNFNATPDFKNIE